MIDPRYTELSARQIEILKGFGREETYLEPRCLVRRIKAQKMIVSYLGIKP